MQLLLALMASLACLFSAAPLAHGQNSSDTGLIAEITGVTIPADRRPVVMFKISDAKGKPLDLDADSVKFTIAAVKTAKSEASDYHN
jgi:hypothetical protein